MTFETFLSLFGMALVASWTPGPNNALLASSGATFGFVRTFPHIIGISLGFPVMIFLVALGFGEILRQSPGVLLALRYLGAALMLWLAWKIANSGPPGSDRPGRRPFRFMEAAGFQWINPKAWMAAIAVTSQFASPERPFLTPLIIAGVFVVAGFSATAAWAAFGRTMGRHLGTGPRLRLFNLAMALSLVAFVAVALGGI